MSAEHAKTLRSGRTKTASARTNHEATCFTAACAAMVLFARPAWADYSAMTLSRQCETFEKLADVRDDGIRIPDNTDAGVCFGYIGFILELALLKDPAGGPAFQLHICAPAGVSTVQAIKVFLNHTRANPARLHEPAILEALSSLVKAFPCAGDTINR